MYSTNIFEIDISTSTNNCTYYKSEWVNKIHFGHNRYLLFLTCMCLAINEKEKVTMVGFMSSKLI